MVEKSRFILPSLRLDGARLVPWVAGILCVGLFVSLIARVTIQFATTPLPHRLLFEQDIPLPGPLTGAYRTSKDPLAPGLSLFFDHFDFQALDSQNHLLFLAHTGPSPDRMHQIRPSFDPDKDAKLDGNIVIFDTQKKKVVGLLDLPQVAGVTLAPDLHKVYASDANDNIVYSIDERTLKATPIELQPNDSPDAMAYDQADHLLFVSCPGVPSHPDQSNVIDRKNQNETVINTLTDKVVAVIPLGLDGKWGDDVGHVRFDPGLHRIYVVTQPSPDPDSPDPNVMPDPGTARLVEINPTTLRIVTRMLLPYNCFIPHGLAIDTEQHIAYVACIDTDPPSLYRVDLRTMQNFAEPPWPVPVKPDIITLDRPLHLVYVGCGAGIAIFQENGRAFKWLGSYTYGVSTHTIAVNEETHELYVPIPRIGGRAVLRIMRYDPNGVV